MNKTEIVRKTVLSRLKTQFRVFRNAVYLDLNIGDLGPQFQALERSGLVKTVRVKGAIAYEYI